MKRKKRLFVWILAAMLLFSQLLVYASEPGREKETGRVEEKVHTEKTVQEEPEDEKKETESEPERIRIEAEHVNVSIQTKTIKTEELITAELEVEDGYDLYMLSIYDEKGVEVPADLADIPKSFSFYMPEGTVSVVAQAVQELQTLGMGERELHPGITVQEYNSGGNRIEDVIPNATRTNVNNWLHSHENDNYYLGTPYPERSDGSFIPGRNGGTDTRNPNGDCQGENGYDDIAGQAMMNCTGFVWHVLYKASGMDYQAAYDRIPAWGGVGAGNWRDFLRNNGIEYRTYQSENPDKINELLHSIVGLDGYIEKGDIIWTWDGAVGGDGLPAGTSGSHHVGIYTGVGSNYNEWWHSLGYSVYMNKYYNTNFKSLVMPKNPCVAVTVIKLSDQQKEGKVKLKKSSANPEITNGSSCYSISGAKYGVFSDEGCSQKVGELVTDEAGNTPELVLEAGTYYCKELEAPKGYALDRTVHKVEVTANQTAELKVADVPQMDPVGVLLGKVDKETNQNKPQGSASMEGAEFTMKYYAVDPATNGKQDPAEQGHQPKRRWIFKTNADGFCYYEQKYLASGDELYLSPSGNPQLPLGVATIQETKAPEGYLLNPTVYVIPITSENNGSEFVYTYNAPTIPESILSLEIIKKEKGIDRPIPGVVFTHTDPDGKKTDVTTNEKGSVTLKGLSRGTHTIQEKSVPAGYTKNPGVVKFKVDENNKITEVGNTSTEASGKMILTLKPDGTAQLSVEDILAPYRLLLHKENDKGKLLEGAEFTLYADRECKKELQKKVTDSKGTLAFPNLQVNTKYYLKETKAPEGYRIPVGSDGAPVVYEIYTKSNPVTGSFEYYVNGTKHTETSGDFAITGTKQDREVNLKVVNIIGLQMPETGSTGTLLLLLLGVGCAGAAVYQYRKGGKDHEKN